MRHPQIDWVLHAMLLQTTEMPQVLQIQANSVQTSHNVSPALHVTSAGDDKQCRSAYLQKYMTEKAVSRRGTEQWS